MTNTPNTDFIFALTNPGSERALKAEVLADALDWRSSYQRKGFVTFKREGGFTLDALAPTLACARRICLSLGKTGTRDEAESLIRETLAGPVMIHLARHHLGKMEGEVSPSSPEGVPRAGERIGTVVELSPNEYWAGIHQVNAMVSPDPAGDPGLVMPETSPSRAWLKLEEAIRFFDLNLGPADRVVELGCAPGGVVLALMDRDVPVVGVDPAGMDKVLKPYTIVERQNPPKNSPWFYHCRKPAALASKRDLGADVTWFMSDMNQSPTVVLKECARFVQMCPSISSLLITLKLSRPEEVVEKDQWIKTVQKMGFKQVRLQQLAAHHRELVLYARKS